jgi:predicted transcriptional regulator
MSEPTTQIIVELPLEVKGVELQEWQIHQIEEGLREADAGDFASDGEVATVFAIWTNAR